MRMGNAIPPIRSEKNILWKQRMHQRTETRLCIFSAYNPNLVLSYCLRDAAAFDARSFQLGWKHKRVWKRYTSKLGSEASSQKHR